MESLVGLDVTLTTTSASSSTLAAGTFATDGDVTRTYLNETNMFARTIADHAIEYQTMYDYAAVDGQTSREVTTLADGREYETTYTFTSENSGTWTETFNMGEVESEGTFTIRETPVTTNAEGNITVGGVFDGRNRTQLIHFPPNFSPDENLPMVLAMHGAGGNNLEMLNFSEYDEIADVARVVVIFPQSSGNTWNSNLNNGIDDVGFLTSVIDDAIANYGVDGDRVYASGFSNGAFMATTLACDVGERIAGIAPVAGHLIGDQSSCLRGNNVPAIFFQGDSDTSVPITGSGSLFGPTADTVALFASELGCDPTQTREAIPDIDMNDQSTVVRLIQDGRPADTGVEYYIIEGGRHRWPGGDTNFMPSGSNRDISASHLAWEFFSRFP